MIVHSVLGSVGDFGTYGVRIIAGQHLEALIDVLPGSLSTIFISLGNEGFPSLFDIRKRGLIRGISSAITLRRELMKLIRLPGEALVFDRGESRARFISGNWPALSLSPNAPNIYRAYISFLGDRNIVTAFDLERRFRLAGNRVGIFPTSRVARKNIPVEILNVILSLISKAGLNPTVFCLEGDPPIGLLRTSPQIIAKNFSSLIEATRSVDYVISADSLPAHLAEYVGRPVFVVSPSPNQYWLPYRCFIHGYWGIFSDTKALGISLDRFLGDAVAD